MEFVSPKPVVTVGRHPANDFQFDPQQDLDVSAKHAQFVLRDGRWHVEDLGSSNGTLVNGFAISATTRLEDTDQVKLGANGPNIEFRIVKDAKPDGISGQPAVARTSVAGSEKQAPRETSQSSKPAAPRPQESATQRIRIEVQKQTQGLRRLTVALLIALVGVAAAFFVLDQRNQRERASAVEAMQARVDSVLAVSSQTVAALEGQMEGMRDALQRSENNVRRLQTSLGEAQLAGDAERVSSLQQQLSETMSALGSLRAAALTDFNTVWEANQRAVALIYVEFGPGNVETGTAFAVRSDGTMLTNKHVVAGANGNRRATRIGVKFADSPQVFAATVVAISPDADLAVIRAPIRGGVPTVQSLASRESAARPGQPAAVIGFPLGTDLLMRGEGNRQIATTTLTVGTVSQALSDRIQLDAWGAEGSSGSPIFNGQGEVVAVLWGGLDGTGGNVVYGVPVSFARTLLESID